MKRKRDDKNSWSYRNLKTKLKEGIQSDGSLDKNKEDNVEKSLMLRMTTDFRNTGDGANQNFVELGCEL